MFDFMNLNPGFDEDEQDVFGVELDLDGDGDADAAAIDLDGDGIVDVIVTDTDDDGIYDSVQIPVDTDGDGVFDAIRIFDMDAETGEIQLTPVEDSAGSAAGTYAEELTQFDPAKADMNAVSGNPIPAMEKWEYQGDTGRCALYSQKFVIEELTGQELDADDLAELAQERGWFSEESGTPLMSMNKILDHYGISNEMSFYNSISDIQECLDSGGKVIVSIDADEIWYGETDNLFTPGDGPNHAVEVIGIDNSNPFEPMVVLNDSGNPNGCGEMVPLDTFLDAWEDGNCQMIACM